jgi:ATP-binding cassette, subfamily C, bacterial
MNANTRRSASMIDLADDRDPEAEDRVGLNSTAGQAWRFVSDFVRFGGRRMGGAAILVGLGALVEGLGVLMLVPLLAMVTGTGEGSGWIAGLARPVLELFEDQSRLTTLAAFLAVFGCLIAVRSVIILMRDLALTRLQMGFVEDRRLAIIGGLAATDWATVSRLSHARIAHVLSSDVQRCSTAATFAVQASVASVMLTAQLALAFLLSPELAALSLALLVAAALLLGPSLIRAHGRGREATIGQFALTRDTGQFLGGLKQAFTHNRQEAFVRQAHQTLDVLRLGRIAFVRQSTGTRMALTAAASVIAGISLLVGYGVLKLEPAVLMTLLFVLARIAGPVGQIQQGALQLAHALPAYALVRALEADLEAAAPAPQPVTAADPALPHFAPVTFEAVSFSHRPGSDQESDGARGVIDLRLVLEPASFIGLSGPSGSGKTTFADLLSGLYLPASGRISVGGRLLDSAAARAWRDRIAYVPQDPFLFHDTIRRNLLASTPEATEPQLWEALRIAGAEELVRRQLNGLDTVIGERGAQVSGGERQRLALAAALLRRPEVFILDEATSAVDVETERGMLERLRAAFSMSMIVIIAHRAESLSLCDRVFTLVDGRLVGVTEQGDASG